jgi:hypothetical protein
MWTITLLLLLTSSASHLFGKLIPRFVACALYFSALPVACSSVGAVVSIPSSIASWVALFSFHLLSTFCMYFSPDRRFMFSLEHLFTRLGNPCPHYSYLLLIFTSSISHSSIKPPVQAPPSKPFFK